MNASLTESEYSILMEQKKLFDFLAVGGIELPNPDGS